MKTKTIILLGAAALVVYYVTTRKGAGNASQTIGSDGKPTGVTNPFTGLPIGGNYTQDAAGRSQPGYSLGNVTEANPVQNTGGQGWTTGLQQQWDNFWYGGD